MEAKPSGGDNHQREKIGIYNDYNNKTTTAATTIMGSCSSCCLGVFRRMLTMMATTKHENTIRKIRQLSQQTMPKGAQVMLYGSQARGDAREDSDWDILIILDKPKVEQSDHDNIAFPFTMLGWELGEAIIPVIYTREEWANSSFMPFYKNVERDKIILQ